MLAKIAWIGFSRSSWKYEPSQRRKNRPKRIAEDHRDEREPREVEGHDQQVEREHPQEEHRRADSAASGTDRPCPWTWRASSGRVRRVLASSAWGRRPSLSGLVGSCVRSWMIDIPTAQIKATMAVGYKKITLGHMKIRMPCSRCVAADTGVEDEVADFASVDMTGNLRAEKSSQVLADREPSSHAERVPDDRAKSS